MLSMHRPLPSMLIMIPCRFRVPVKSSLVNWLPWSILKIWMARDAVRVARDARIAGRKAAKLAAEARQAAALAAAQLVEAATREAALKAEQDTRDAEFAERIARE